MSGLYENFLAELMTTAASADVLIDSYGSSVHQVASFRWFAAVTGTRVLVLRSGNPNRPAGGTWWWLLPDFMVMSRQAR